MIKSVVALDRDGLDVNVMVLNFEVPDKDFDIEAAARAAALEYCQTEEGRTTYIGNCDSFNWGDFYTCVPQNICRRHGFAHVEPPVADILVDFNEQLVDEIAVLGDRDEEEFKEVSLDGKIACAEKENQSFATSSDEVLKNIREGDFGCR